MLSNSSGFVAYPLTSAQHFLTFRRRKRAFAIVLAAPDLLVNVPMVGTEATLSVATGIGLSAYAPTEIL